MNDLIRLIISLRDHGKAFPDTILVFVAVAVWIIGGVALAYLVSFIPLIGWIPLGLYALFGLPWLMRLFQDGRWRGPL